MGFFGNLYSYRDRVLTGLVLVGAFSFFSVLDSFFMWWLIIGVMYALSFYEATKLFKIENNTVFIMGGLLWVAAYFYPHADDLIFFFGIVFASYMAYTARNDWQLFLPFLYPAVGHLFILTLYYEYEFVALFWFVLIVVATDIGAFVVGKSMGRHPFSPSSPNKTIEGVVGGVVVATFLGFFVGVVLVDMQKAILFSLLVSLSSVFGDLFESQLKRRAGVKDSGNILPGHGGMLDRMDGYLFASITLVVLLRSLS
ncbi:MAG: CDP-diglyceride synthetase [Sulfuricurvum sp. PC08-66]|nr:MAG: CDP-diglyceride synthetase [Sulfuricurvum sp. PC08-66]